MKPVSAFRAVRALNYGVLVHKNVKTRILSMYV